jgi:uracil-DNA glycosylase
MVGGVKNGSLTLFPDRVVLIGQAPSSAMPKDARPLVGGLSGTFIQGLTGCMTLREYVRRYVTLNLLEYYPGKNGKGDKFPPMEARLSAIELTPKLVGRKVVFVGLSVAEAFGLISPINFFEWRRCPSAWDVPWFQGAAIPHPSGINRFWNYPANMEKAERFFGALRG